MELPNTVQPIYAARRVRTGVACFCMILVKKFELLSSEQANETDYLLFGDGNDSPTHRLFAGNLFAKDKQHVCERQAIRLQALDVERTLV